MENFSQPHSSSEANARNSDPDKTWFRTDRFFLADGQWYFTTRDNRDVGPFGTREKAAHGLELFLECMSKPDASIDHAISIAKLGELSIVGFH